MARVIFSIGSNAEDRQIKVSEAVDELHSLVGDLRVSECFESPSYNGMGPDYVNVVAVGHSELPCDRLDVFCKAFEWQLGRDRDTECDGIVAVDIDIVVYDEKILKPLDYKQPEFISAMNVLIS